MKSSSAATDTPVVVAIFKAAFGMNERMEKARAVKMAFAKLIGGMAGAGLFVATATWGMAFCSSPGMSEQDVFVRLLASGVWLAQCTWMGSALSAMVWLRQSHLEREISGREMILLAVFGVTPKAWARVST